MIILDFIRMFAIEHSSLLFSVIALIISLKVARISAESRLNTKHNWEHDLALKVRGKRSEILNEIDKQHALFGTLLSIFYQKTLLLRQYPHLHEKYSDENKRIASNSSVIQLLKERYNIQRSSSENISVDNDLSNLEIILAEIRRLTIHIQEDIKKEQSGLDFMLKQGLI